jgi:hypothetical protein
MSKSPIYPRIARWADGSYGEDLMCLPCRETRAVCPDCEAAVCVYCEDNCPGCGVSVFHTEDNDDDVILEESWTTN